VVWEKVSDKTRVSSQIKMEDHQGVFAFWPEIHLELLRFPWIIAGVNAFSTEQQKKSILKRCLQELLSNTTYSYQVKIPWRVYECFVLRWKFLDLDMDTFLILYSVSKNQFYPVSPGIVSKFRSALLYLALPCCGMFSLMISWECTLPGQRDRWVFNICSLFI
jgi:hypothetical protein